MTTEATPTHGTSESITANPPAPPPPPAPVPAAPTDETAPPWVVKTDYLLLGLLLILSFFVASFTASNSDLWMHLATGKRISEGTFEFGVDPFSWATEATADKPAVPWIHQSWLFSLLVYKIHESALGGAGLVAIKAILFTLAIALLSRIGWNGSNRWFLLICLVMAVLAASSRLFLQPMVVSMVFLAITVYLLDRAGVFTLPLPSPPGRAAGGEGVADTRWLWALPPLFALWANLDAWFVLGLLILVLAWAATGLAGRFGSSMAVSGKLLGLVFGASLLACLLNPFHVHVFQLPPELAYLVLTITEPFHIPMPDEMVAGGKALKELRRVEPELAWTMPALYSNYFWDIRFGKNIAGLAFYPLLLLGLLGFVLVGMVKPHKNAPTFHVARFLIWLAFAIMALSLYRMIPFFVIVVAPLTAMTLGEFLLWQQQSAAVPTERRDRGLKLARLVSVPFFLLLLYLAWPGWLHGSTEFNSRRRVAWSVSADPSIQKAAETLQALKASGEGNNVFNGDLELGNLLPWFAPDVKFCMDARFALYAGEVIPFGKMRDSLYGDLPDADWQKIFAEHKVDQIALTRFISNDNIRRVMRFWLSPEEWRPRYGDRRIIVVSWCGPNQRWPMGKANDDLERAAFGSVPVERRPPLHGTPPPQAPSLWTLYLDGIGNPPVELSEISLYKLRNEIMNQIKEGDARMTLLSALCAPMTDVQGMPASNVGIGTTVNFERAINRLNEVSPPALPILMVRAARRAVAENPLDPAAHLDLAEANDNLRRMQEDRWMIQQRQPGRGHPAPLRDRMRQIQQITGLYNAVQLQPDSHLHHDRLAKHYLQQNLIDLALEHMLLAEKGLESRRASVPSANAKAFNDIVKQYHDEIDSLDKNVKQRAAKWKEMTTGKSPLEKAFFAHRGTFDMLIDNQRVTTPLGLGKKAFDLLVAVEPESLAQGERLAYVLMRFDLLISMGRADLVGESLSDENIRKSLDPEIYGQYQFFVGAALGDYEAMDQGLSTFEKAFRDKAPPVRNDVEKRGAEAISMIVMAGTQDSCVNLFGTVMARTIPILLAAEHAVLTQQRLRGELSNTLTLHGIILLEAGDTKKAREFFQRAIAEGDRTVFFTERPIARRYLECLDRQQR